MSPFGVFTATAMSTASYTRTAPSAQVELACGTWRSASAAARTTKSVSDGVTSGCSSLRLSQQTERRVHHALDAQIEVRHRLLGLLQPGRRDPPHGGQRILLERDVRTGRPAGLARCGRRRGRHRAVGQRRAPLRCQHPVDVRLADPTAATGAADRRQIQPGRRRHPARHRGRDRRRRTIHDGGRPRAWAGGRGWRRGPLVPAGRGIGSNRSRISLDRLGRRGRRRGRLAVRLVRDERQQCPLFEPLCAGGHLDRADNTRGRRLELYVCLVRLDL